MSHDHCAVTADLNRYLSSIERSDAVDELIKRRTEDLLLADYAPDLVGNVSEAFSELPEEAVSKIAENIGAAMAEKNESARAVYLQLIGQVVLEETHKYWEALAANKARRTVDEADCRRCYDQGCRFCQPAEDY